MVNFYSKIKTEKSHNPAYNTSHKFEIPFRMVICGNSGSGKTSTLLNILYNMPDTFTQVILCIKDSDEPLYKLLKEKPIDKVTVELLSMALRMVGIIFDDKTIDKIIDLVELLEKKGGETSIEDIVKLQAEWESL